MKKSIVIPTFNEGATIAAWLQALQPLRRQGWDLVLVDGGSQDGTARLAANLVDRLLYSAPGRARQMNAGWRAVMPAEVVVFLHADTWLPADFAACMEQFMASGRDWGRFDVQLSGQRRVFRAIAWLMNRRSRLTGIATGDQALFFKGGMLEQLQGYADIELMEDIDICKRAKRLSPPLCLPQQVVTSSRKWESRGVVNTVLLMWRIRLAYFFGASPARLQKRYYRG